MDYSIKPEMHILLDWCATANIKQHVLKGLELLLNEHEFNLANLFQL